MTEKQWKSFTDFRDKYRSLCAEWAKFSCELYPLQLKAAEKTPSYNLETSVVYNKAYDEICETDEIALIVVGDNPGKEEQLACNCRYLVGQSGRIAEGFFRRNPSLGTDFRKNVLILNKTPVHTAKTTQLKTVFQNGSERIRHLLSETQFEMARLSFCLHAGLFDGALETSSSRTAEVPCQPELWLVGYSELRPKGVFEGYRNELKRCYEGHRLWDKVFVFQHFSMNRFLIDLTSFQKKNGLPLKESLEQLGKIHRKEIFGS